MSSPIIKNPSELFIFTTLLQKLNFFLLKHPFIRTGLIRKYIIKKIFPKQQVPIKISTRYGFEVICSDPYNDRGVENSLFFYGTYEAGTLAFISNFLAPNDTFIDIGANIGFISIFSSYKVGDSGAVYSFEPFPETFALFEKNVTLNGIKNILLFELAVGEFEDTSIMYSRKGYGSGSNSFFKPENNVFSKSSPVEIVSLDRFIKSNNIDNPKILKIDVEGWEHEVLKGATKLLSKKNAPIIIIEHSNFTSKYTSNVFNSHELITSLNEYQPYKLKYGKEIPSRLLNIKTKFDFPKHDNVFYMLPHHFDTEFSTKVFL